MRQCQQQLDWSDEATDAQNAEREVKAEALKELTEWLGEDGATMELQGNAQLQEELLQIVRINLFR